MVILLSTPSQQNMLVANGRLYHTHSGGTVVDFHNLPFYPREEPEIIEFINYFIIATQNQVKNIERTF